ncbi:MAG: succinate dehydrogenase cytochrome b subunit [Halobacteriovoraceae bacterium]|nr:succinate dehydrogenase cytochrome b subunit [Halobacteriovoraceae bacterium]
MKLFFSYVHSSIVKKQVMGVTGLLLCGFLITHLAGNCLIYVGGEAFNTYAHKLITNPFIYVAEAILALIFLSHIGLAIRLTIENKKARPQKYYMKVATGRGATFASSTMPYTGLIILIFLISHLLHFKFSGHSYKEIYNGVEMKDLYKVVIEYFANPLNVLWYLFSMAALGIHVSHGFWSAFQSIGFNHPKYNCGLKILSKIYALIIFIGFSALPIYAFLQGVKA